MGVDIVLILLKVICFIFLKYVINTAGLIIFTFAGYQIIRRLKNFGYGIIVLIVMLFGTLGLLSIDILLDVYLPTNITEIKI